MALGPGPARGIPSRPNRALTGDDYGQLSGVIDSDDLKRRDMELKTPRELQPTERREWRLPRTDMVFKILYTDAGRTKFLRWLFGEHAVTDTGFVIGTWPNLYYNIIQRYWRLGQPDRAIEKELGLRKDRAGYLVQQIRRSINGQTPNGKPKTGRKRGCPANLQKYLREKRLREGRGKRKKASP
jgi:hypothetical protein